MKLINDNISRSQVQWLALHALVLVGVGLIVYASSQEEAWNYRTKTGSLSFIVANLGGCMMSAAGLALIIASGVRLAQPFHVIKMAVDFSKYALLEAIVVGLIGGLILDGGELGFLLGRVFLLINITVLGFRTL